MKVFTYGFDRSLQPVIKKCFGDHLYVDVTDTYQDILALPADIVIVNTENCEAGILNLIKEYESETIEVEERRYEYVTAAFLRQCAGIPQNICEETSQESRWIL